MHRKLLGIINVDFDATGRLLIIYSAFIKTSKKIIIQKGISSCIIFSLNLVSPMKLVRLIIMCLNETYSRVWVGKHQSDMFPIRYGLKQRDAFFLPLVFNFALEYAIRGFR